MTAVPPRPSPPDEQQDDGRAGRGRPRTWPWWVAAFAALGASVLAWTPGVEVDLQLFRLSAHDPTPLALVAAAAAAGALAWRRRSAVAVDVPHMLEDLRRHARWWAGGLALAAVAYGVGWNTWTIGGSDSHCYAAQARAFASGDIHVSQPLTSEAPWPDAATTFAPVGFLPSETTAGELLPVCAPGYSLLVVPLLLVWPPLQFLVAPLAAGVLVVAAYLLAGRFEDEPLAGIGAALFTATAPVVLFQATQPMTDVPAAAAVATATALAFRAQPRLRAAGLALGVALLIRPNLLPLAVPFVAFCLAWGGRMAVARMSSTLVPVASLVLVLNTLVYGAPWKSGYGDTSTLFALANVPINAGRFVTWVLETMTPIVGLGLAAPWLLPAGDGNNGRRARAIWLLAVAAAVVACYLPYQPFEEWWYLRFLLPAIPLACALSSGALFALLRRAGRAGAAMSLITIGAVSLHGLREADRRHVFRMWRVEQRLSATAEDIGRNTPNAAAIAVQPNGAISYGLGQPIVSWDSLAPESLDVAMAWLRSRGLRPLLVLDQEEESAFRQRFEKASGSGALDWPPATVVYRSVRVYDPADRDAYLAAQPRPTRFVDPPRDRR